MILSKMRAAAPPGQRCLSPDVLEELRDLTRALVSARGGADGEHRRFLSIRQRGLDVPEEALDSRVKDATVMVTGGTGCIGSELIRQLAVRGTGRLVSVSRGGTDGYLRLPVAEYLHADVRDHQAMARLMRVISPDLVFHVAAQRDPGLAETQVHRTVSTNVLGTRAVLSAAADAGVPQVVCASTGKALRPYSPDMYTASKRAAEWVTSQAAGFVTVSAARFTHVLDNSIIYSRLLGWAERGETVRLHSPDISFYVQSARESAQLLLLSCLSAVPGEYRVSAIADLGWPVRLLDLVLAVLAQAGSRSPLYLSGYDQGYEEVAFPGLYDPATAGDITPLFNAFEAAALASPPCPGVDTFSVTAAPDPIAAKLLGVLDWTCGRTGERGDQSLVRGAQDDLSWALLDGTLRAVPRPVLARSAALARQHGESLGACHRRVLSAIEAQLA